METIIVPTDFSPSADNAMNYAAQLARMVNASVLLVHFYQIPISMNDVPVMMISADELKTNAEKGMERTREQLQKTYPDLDIKTETRLGDVVDELKDICADVQPLTLVVGKHGATGVERFLFGSTTISIIRHSEFPVISVPSGFTTFQLKNMALAIDASGWGQKEQNIRAWVHNINARLHIIHVQESEKEGLAQNDLLNDLKPVYQTIRNEEVVQGINAYIHTHAIDLLTILPHKHNLMDRLFFKTHTRELIEKINIPIMCIPES